MFPGRYSEIFGLGERLGCILNFGHSFDAIEAYFEFASMLITLAPCSSRGLQGSWSARRVNDQLTLIRPRDSVARGANAKPKH